MLPGIVIASVGAVVALRFIPAAVSEAGFPYKLEFIVVLVVQL